jgi:hypothetical protein
MKSKTALLRICVLQLLVTVVIAQRPEEELLRQNPSAKFRNGVGRPLPVVSLPAKVSAPEGKITLWADFAAADDTGVPLYVVNQTNKEHSFDTQDGDPRVKLEYKDAKGTWRRAQAHLSSWCGNSYFSVTLPPRQFFIFRGYRPTAGSKQVVRYAIQGGELASNESEGMISDLDLKAVTIDSLTAGEIPYRFWQAIETEGDAPVPQILPLKTRAESIRCLIWYPRNEVAINRVKELKPKVLALPASADREALSSAMDDYLAKVDAPKPSPAELMKLCIARITDDSSADPSMDKDTAWRLLAVPPPSGDSPSNSAYGLDPRDWQRVIAPAVALLKQDAKQGIHGGAEAILSAGWIVDTLVTDEGLLGWLSQTSSERLHLLGAEALARRSRFSNLVEFAWKQPGPVQLKILPILAFAGPRYTSGGTRRSVRQPAYENKEHLFWEHCAKTMPIETANALWDHDYTNGRNPFNRLIHDPLHDHFKSEAARSLAEVEITQQQAYPLRSALRMLASWRMEEDDAVMTALLKHGAYIKEGSRREDLDIVKKRFLYREIAKEALIARGQAVPSDAVVESVISSVPVQR